MINLAFARVTLLDVCQASQKELAKRFSNPGCCFGDLRRIELVARVMERPQQIHRNMAPEVIYQESGESRQIARSTTFQCGGSSKRKGLDARDIARAELLCFATD